MIDLIAEKRDDLIRLCERFRVERLELFGSATKDRFVEESSDLDFLVEFQTLPWGEHADAYFGLLHAFQDLFQRRIDWVETRAITNPYFLENINQSRTVLYAI